LLSPLLLISSLADAGNIAVVYDGTEEAEAGLRERIENVLTDVLPPSKKPRFLPEHTIYGNWDYPTLKNAVAEITQNRDVELVIFAGTLGSSTSPGIENPRMPVIVPFLYAQDVMGVAPSSESGRGPGVYTLKPESNFRRDIDALVAITHAEHIAILVQQPYIDAAKLPPFFEANGLRIDFVGQERDPDTTRIAEDVEAVLTTAFPWWTDEERHGFFRDLETRKLPSFAIDGERELRYGATMAFARGVDEDRVLRASALIARNLLSGQQAGDLVVRNVGMDELVLSASAMESVGISPSWHVLANARVIDTAPVTGGKSYEEIIALALASNPDLRAAVSNFLATQQDLRTAWSSWLPSLQFGGTTTFNDPRYAPFGGQPVEVQGQLTLEQLLYDEKARAQVPVQKYRVVAEASQLDALAMDIAYNAATTWVETLRAQEAAANARADLELARANLETARIRVQVGDANEAEEARWASEVAGAQSRVVTASAEAARARAGLNRLLGMRPDEQIRLKPLTEEDVAGEGTFQKWTSTAAGLARVATALGQVAHQYSPEIAGARAAYLSQKAWAGATLNQFFIPTLSARLTGGAWAYRGNFQGDFANLPGLPEDALAPANTVWNATINLSLPIFNGLSRDAERVQAKEQQLSLQAQLEGVTLDTELNVRNAVIDTQAAKLAVELAEVALAGAQRNLEWAQDAYARGTATQVQLLEAQNTWRNSLNALTDARYQLFAARVAIMRSAGLIELPNRTLDWDKVERQLLAYLEENTP